MPQAISGDGEGAGLSGHRSWYSCMGNVGLPTRVESSLSLEGFTLKLEALPTGRGLGKGLQDVNMVVLYLILPPILRLQNFD